AQLQRSGRRPERALQLNERFAGLCEMRVAPIADRGDELLFHQLATLGAVPADQHRHARLAVGILISQPALLADARFARIRPEILSADLVMGQPDRAMMVVPGVARMTHSREWRAGRPDEW